MKNKTKELVETENLTNIKKENITIRKDIINSKSDPFIVNVQNWVNNTFRGEEGYTEIEVTGITGWSTIYALLHGLQITLGVGSTANNFGAGTISAFNNFINNYGPIQERTPEADQQLMQDTLSTNEEVRNRALYLVHTLPKINGIIQGALLCKGYSIGATGPTGNFYGGTASAIEELKEDAGLNDTTSIVTLNIMKALMSMDYFFSYDTSEKAQTIIQIQRYLNRNYENYTGIRPCDGIYGSSTNKAIIYALQAEEKLPINVANGNFGPTTQNCCPIVKATTCTGRNYIGQYYDPTDIPLFAPLINMSLYLNGFGQSSNALSTSLNVSTLNEFQRFYSIPEVNECNLTTWMSLMVSSGNPNRSAIACDCATIINNDNISVLIDNNYQYVGRYLSGTISGGISKALSIQELQLLFANNIRVFPIHQGAANYVGYFTTSNAIADATSAVNYANSLNLEFGSIIYFAVDCDVMDYQVTNNIIPYFRTLYEKFMSLCGGKYRVGIYGTRNTCSRVCDAGYACSSFVSDMSTGYSGNLGFAIPENWAFDQFANTTISNNAGTKSIEIDKDGYSGKNPGVGYIYNIAQQLGFDKATGGRIYVNMSNQSIPVYARKEISMETAQYPWYKGFDLIGEIQPGDFYVRYEVTDLVKDTVHKVLFKTDTDVRMGYIEEYYYITDNGIVDSYLPGQKYFNFVNYDPTTNSYIELPDNATEITFTVNKEIPYFDQLENNGFLKKGDIIRVMNPNMRIFGSSRPWTIFVSKKYNPQTNEFEDFNKFVSVGLELGSYKSERALY